MKTTVEVNDRKEAELIKIGLEHEPTRALVKIMGAIAPLDGVRSKVKVLNFVLDFLTEQDERQQAAKEVSIGYSPTDGQSAADERRL